MVILIRFSQAQLTASMTRLAQAKANAGHAWKRRLIPRAAFFMSGERYGIVPNATMTSKRNSLVWRLIHTGLLSGGMSALVAFIVTMVNTGIDDGLGGRCFVAWCLAYPVAWFAALIWGPSARKLTNWLTGTDRKS